MHCIHLASTYPAFSLFVSLFSSCALAFLLFILLSNVVDFLLAFGLFLLFTRSYDLVSIVLSVVIVANNHNRGRVLIRKVNNEGMGMIMCVSNSDR